MNSPTHPYTCPATFDHRHVWQSRGFYTHCEKCGALMFRSVCTHEWQPGIDPRFEVCPHCHTTRKTGTTGGAA